MSLLANANINMEEKLTVGTIVLNYEQIRQAIQELADSYSMTQYSDDAAIVLKEMKADRADLNKMKKVFEERRLAVKNKYMAPYLDFEKQVKELISLLDTPLNTIDSKVKELESKAREEKRKKIDAYWMQVSAPLSDEEREFLYPRLYAPSWENVTATQKAYKEGLEKGIENYLTGIKTINDMESDFVAEGLAKFKETLLLQDAISEMNRLQKQREEVLAREEKRLEEENRTKLEEEREAIRREARNDERQRILAEQAEESKNQMETATAYGQCIPFSKMPISEEMPASSKKIAIRLVSGCITEVYSDLTEHIEVLILDEDVASQRETLAFDKEVSVMNTIY